MDSFKVAVFDSGVGGLTIFAKLAKQVRGIELVYVSDNAHYPYGLKKDEAVVAYTEETVSKLYQRFPYDLLVVACNTASTIALPQLRQKLTMPIVGVVPAIKPAAQISQTRCIGLLATPATIARAYTHQLIADFASDCQVIAVGSSVLVDLAEAKLRGHSPSMDSLRSEIKPFLAEPRIDTIVLACTHFPLLAGELALAIERPVTLVDSGDAVAKRVASLLPPEIPPVSALIGPAFFSESRATIKELSLALKLHFSITEIDFL